MGGNVLTLFPAAGPNFETGSRGGDYTVELRVSGSDYYPLKGGMGDYQPRKVLLVWTTDDGDTWTFRHAVTTGPQIEQRTGVPGVFTTSQTLYLGDPGYRDCEPAWLADLVDQHAPGKATA